MNGWIASIRPKSVLTSCLLAFVGFKLSGYTGTLTIVLVLSFLFFFVSAVMSTNDWCDRMHDLKKGKSFAFKQGSTYRNFTVVLWFFSLIVAVLLFSIEVSLGVLSVLLIGLGLTYTLIMKVPLLPGLYVCITAGCTVIYALLVSYNQSTLLLVLGATLFIWAREIIKDLQDKEIDAGYKWTFPVIIGERGSVLLIALFLSVALGCTLLITPYVLAGLPFIIIALIVLAGGKNPSVSKAACDFGMLSVLGILYFIK